MSDERVHDQPERSGPGDDDQSASGNATEAPWWRDAVVYQLYPRSFADGNGDGTGDIAGIRSRLPYLADLGVDAIWVTPWYPSPLNDGGYDVADFRDIDPRFGSLGEAESLIADAHEVGIRMIVDLVPNHTSSEHRWFQAALAAGPGSPERARYVFRSGKGPDGSRPPTNWTSVFGGPAWERVDDGEWYLHLFDTTQPDLDWENDEVRSEFDDVLRFWLDRGVDGFRIDVAHGMVKDQDFPDLDAETGILEGAFVENHPYWDRDGVHEINRRWRAVLDESERDAMMVAEAWVRPDRISLYVRPDEYHQSFNFDFLETDWLIEPVRDAIDQGIAAAGRVDSSPTWTLSNHDVMRHASRYGLPPGTKWRTWPVTGPFDLLDPVAGVARARAASLMLLALPGSTYIYQGEELGLPEVWDLPVEALDDPVWENSGHRQRGRDGCRVPIPWSTDGPSFGFGSAAPWLPQPASFGELSLEAQTNDAASTLAMYRSALRVRNDLLVGDTEFAWVDLGGDVLAFRRGCGVTCVVNFGDRAVAVPEGRTLVASIPEIGSTLPSDAAVWIQPR